MLFAFGSVKAELRGSDSLIGSFRESWHSFMTVEEGNQADVIIDISPLTFPDDSQNADGWSTQTVNGQSMNVYSRKGKALFALKQTDRKNVRVFVSGENRGIVRLGIQFAFMTAMYRECFGLHGVTIACGNEIIILSAPSGTGKTTLAKLLEKHCDGIAINGDFALLRPTEDGAIYEPTPFCGTSGRTLNHRLKVNRVVFLSQAIRNEWRTLDGREALTQFMSNIFIPNWDACITKTVQENILKSIPMIHVNSFAFAPTQEAAKTFITKLNA